MYDSMYDWLTTLLYLKQKQWEAPAQCIVVLHDEWVFKDSQSLF